MTRAPLLTWGSLALAGGCTPMVWEHRSFGTPPTVVESEECRRSAYREAQHHAYFYAFTRPRFYRDGRGGPILDPWPSFGADDPFFPEQGLYRFCLRAKGYHLVPAPPLDSGVGAHAPTEAGAETNE